MMKNPQQIAKAIIKSAPTLANAETMAQAIVDIAVAMRALQNSRLSRCAIILLIQDSVGMGISKDNIGRVIDAAAQLDKTYLL